MTPELKTIIVNHNWAEQVAKLEAELASCTNAKKREFFASCLMIAKNQAARQKASRK